MQEEKTTAEPRALRGLLRRTARFLGYIGLFVSLVIGAELLMGGTVAVAQEFGFAVNGVRMMRYVMLAFYALIFVGFIARRR